MSDNPTAENLREWAAFLNFDEIDCGIARGIAAYLRRKADEQEAARRKALITRLENDYDTYD